MSGGSVFSIGVPVGRAGLGIIAWQAAAGLHAAGRLTRLIVSWVARWPVPRHKVKALGLPGRAIKKLAFYDKTGQAIDWTDVLYDAWAARQLPPCELLHGWCNMGLRQIRRAKQLGAVALLERANTHIAHQAAVLQAEAQRWGWPHRPVVASSLRRSLAEYDEADFIIVPSEFAYQTFIERGCPAERLVCLPYGVDLAVHSPGEPRVGGPLRVLYVGQVTLRKGVPYLLDAWQRARLPNAQLVLAGQVLPDMQAMAARYRSDPSIEWLGFRHDTPAVFNSADIFVFPSLEEGSALVTYEAMAHALPLIVTLEAGAVMCHEEHGLVVPPRDPDALAAALTRLAADPALRRALGQAGRRRVEAYTWAHYGRRLARIHQRLAAGERPTGPQWALEPDA